MERRLEDGRAVLVHLESALINVSCDDPGAPIGQQLALPILQDRLDGKAREYAAQRAAAAEEAIIKEEVRMPHLRRGSLRILVTFLESASSRNICRLVVRASETSSLAAFSCHWV